ncbi:MAG: hypothetical protein GY765_08150, partial [bacterium]|nr:hypothetical protein [bacterium]
ITEGSKPSEKVFYRAGFRVVGTIGAPEPLPRVNPLEELRAEWPEAVALLERTFRNQPGSGILAKVLIEYTFEADNTELGRETMHLFGEQTKKSDAALPYLAMAKGLLDRELVEDARNILEKMPPVAKIDDTVEAAVLKKRARDFQAAHSLFERAYAISPDAPKILQEFAQTKIGLAKNTHDTKNLPVKKRLNTEAAELLRKAITLTDDTTREAWCWFDLAGTLDRLRARKSEVENAYLKAMELLPHVDMFCDAYNKWQTKTGQTKTGKN